MAVVAVAVALTVVLGVVVVPRTGWFGPRARFRATTLPSCAEILTAPRVEDAVRTAFAATWAERRFLYAPGPAGLCLVTALPKAVLAEDFPADGTPWSRNLGVSFLVTNEDWNSGNRPWYRRGGVREAKDRYREKVGDTCGDGKGEDLTAEEDLGDEASGCWTSSFDKPSRQLLFRISNLIVDLHYEGMNFERGGEDPSASREDLADNARCIAEAIAEFFDAPVHHPHHCGQPALNA
ncbi:hypothetical protein MKOR_26470 [Mycolicibacillus koreensis]|nr:hypothetical protein MKOR_26470 [Mycolicibacillus koreensis]